MFATRPRRLDFLGVDIVHGCQLRCIGCPNSGIKPKISFMSATDFDACLKNVDVYSIRLLRLFNFGEALLHPNVPEILSLIPRQRFHVREVEISTNAQAPNFAMLAEMFKTKVLNTLFVSCDGNGTPEDYERLRPPAKWEKLLEFLAKAREFRDAYSPHTRLMTRSVCETTEGRRRWLDVVEPLGFTLRFINWLNLFDSTRTPLGEEGFAANGICHYLQRKRTLYVDYDGTVVTCCFHPRAGVLGNLKQSKFSEILRGEPFSLFVQRLMTNRKEMPVCGKCMVRRHRHRYERLLDWPLRWVRQVVGTGLSSQSPINQTKLAAIINDTGS